jgi:uncharacterized protein
VTEPSGTRWNSDAGCPPSRGRAGRIRIGALAAAALLPLLLRPASATEPDLAFGAFQTGFYLTAFGIAINRIELKKDPKAMTLLGELYTGGLGVPQNDGKAAEWYKLAADRGDREAMFALAMFRVQGRAEAGAKWLATAAKLGHPLAAYDLALLYMEGQLFPQDFTRAAELLRAAAQAGLPEVQYALGTLYKQGRGVAKDMTEATRLWGDRLARIFAEGRGAPKNPVDATKWHLISKARGETNLTLDDFVNKLDPATRAAGEKAAQPWVTAVQEPKG